MYNEQCIQTNEQYSLWTTCILQFPYTVQWNLQWLQWRQEWVFSKQTQTEKKRNIRKGFKLIQNLEETFLSVTSPAGYSRVSLSNTRKKKITTQIFFRNFLLYYLLLRASLWSNSLVSTVLGFDQAALLYGKNFCSHDLKINHNDVDIWWNFYDKPKFMSYKSMILSRYKNQRLLRDNFKITCIIMRWTAQCNILKGNWYL